MSSTTRRGFLKRAGAAVVALTLSRCLPGIAGDVPKALPKPGTSIALQRGDVFQIEGVYARNPITGRSTGLLQNFMITADVVGESIPASVLYPSNILSAPVPASQVKDIGFFGITVAEGVVAQG